MAEEQVLAMARDGVALFDDYLNLPETERDELRFIPLGNEKVSDEITPPSFTMDSLWDSGNSVPESWLALDGFVAARAILFPDRAGQ